MAMLVGAPRSTSKRGAGWSRYGVKRQPIAKTMRTKKRRAYGRRRGFDLRRLRRVSARLVHHLEELGCALGRSIILVLLYSVVHDRAVLAAQSSSCGSRARPTQSHNARIS